MKSKSHTPSCSYIPCFFPLPLHFISGGGTLILVFRDRAEIDTCTFSDFCLTSSELVYPSHVERPVQHRPPRCFYNLSQGSTTNVRRKHATYFRSPIILVVSHRLEAVGTSWYLRQGSFRQRNHLCATSGYRGQGT